MLKIPLQMFSGLKLVLLFLQLEKLSDKLKEPESQLKFIIEAWKQVNSNFFHLLFDVACLVYSCGFYFMLEGLLRCY